MTSLLWLLPIAVLMGFVGLLAFIWAVNSGQFEDPHGDASRILQNDDQPITDQEKNL